jgi:hypothetical protein
MHEESRRSLSGLPFLIAGSSWWCASRAKVSEIEARRRAITCHEDAAILFDQCRQTDKAHVARQRAERARGMLRLALLEQAKAEAID